MKTNSVVYLYVYVCVDFSSVYKFGSWHNSGEFIPFYDNTTNNNKYNNKTKIFVLEAEQKKNKINKLKEI